MFGEDLIGILDTEFLTFLDTFTEFFNTIFPHSQSAGSVTKITCSALVILLEAFH